MDLGSTGLDGNAVGAAREIVVESGPLRLHALEWGDPGSPTVLFLHGAGLTAHTWDAICSRLQTELHCVAMDLRGHGRSDWSEDGSYELEHFIGDVDRIAADLALDRVAVVGHSLGGRIAMSYAHRRRDIVKQLVLVDTAGATSAAGSARIRAFMSGLASADSLEEFVEHAMRFNPRRDRERLRVSLLHNLQKGSDGKWTWRYDRRRLAKVRTAEELRARDEEFWTAVDATTCPALVVRGGESDILTDEGALALVTRLERGSLVVIDGAGHTVQGDRPFELAAAIREFLLSQPGD